MELRKRKLGKTTTTASGPSVPSPAKMELHGNRAAASSSIPFDALSKPSRKRRDRPQIAKWTGEKVWFTHHHRWLRVANRRIWVAKGNKKAGRLSHANFLRLFHHAFPDMAARNYGWRHVADRWQPRFKDKKPKEWRDIDRPNKWRKDGYPKEEMEVFEKIEEDIKKAAAEIGLALPWVQDGKIIDDEENVTEELLADEESDEEMEDDEEPTLAESYEEEDEEMQNEDGEEDSDEEDSDEEDSDEDDGGEEEDEDGEADVDDEEGGEEEVDDEDEEELMEPEPPKKKGKLPHTAVDDVPPAPETISDTFTSGGAAQEQVAMPFSDQFSYFDFDFEAAFPLFGQAPDAYDAFQATDQAQPGANASNLVGMSDIELAEDAVSRDSYPAWAAAHGVDPMEAGCSYEDFLAGTGRFELH